MLFVLEDQRKPLERILTANPDFKRKFTSKLELPVFINDELVTFGQTYAKENGYKLDEMGILALYSRIDVMQREDHAVTVAEVKEIMDEAIAHSQKANVCLLYTSTCEKWSGGRSYAGRNHREDRVLWSMFRCRGYTGERCVFYPALYTELPEPRRL